MDQWFYAVNDSQQGPVPQALLLQMLRTGQLRPDNLVWHEGMPDWVPAHTVPELNAAGSAPAGAVQPVLGYGVGDSIYQSGPVAFNYAGFWIRFGGYIIDYIVTVVMGWVLGFVGGAIVGALAAGTGGNIKLAAGLLGAVLGLISSWLYFALMHSSSNQASLGQLACGLRVTDMQGNRITFGRATGRYFARLLSGLILCIGFFMMLWSDRKQTLHDQLANTLVLVK